MYGIEAIKLVELSIPTARTISMNKEPPIFALLMQLEQVDKKKEAT